MARRGEGRVALTIFLVDLIRYFVKKEKKKRKKRYYLAAAQERGDGGSVRFDVSTITDVLTRSQNTLETNHKNPRPQTRTFSSRGCSRVDAVGKRTRRCFGSKTRTHAHTRTHKKSAAAYSLRCEQRPFLQSHIQRFIEDILLGVVQNEPCPQSSSNFTLAE